MTLPLELILIDSFIKITFLQTASEFLYENKIVRAYSLINIE